MTSTAFDAQLEAVSAGRVLPPGEIEQLAGAADILPLGMLADAMRRRLCGTRVTYVRTALCAFDGSIADQVPPAAAEVRLRGTPSTLDIALSAVTSARAVAGERAVTGFAWADVVRLAESVQAQPRRVAEQLRSAGLDALAEVPLDEGEALTAVPILAAAGYRFVRLTVRQAPFPARPALFAEANRLQEQHQCIAALNPLPTRHDALKPTTGYEDVKSVALARLAAPSIPSIQVDWTRYGPKLAQVALTFGADDLDAVSASDEAPDGRRRAPLEEVRRNIEAAGFTPAERDGYFHLLKGSGVI